MKKLFLIFLILTTFLFITSCDTKETENNESSSSNEIITDESSSFEIVYPQPNIMAKCENGCCELILGGKYIGNDFENIEFKSAYRIIRTYDELISLVEHGYLLEETVFDENDVLVVYNKSNKKISCFDKIKLYDKTIDVLEYSYEEKDATAEIAYVIIPKKKNFETITGELNIKEFLPTVFDGCIDDVNIGVMEDDLWWEKYGTLYTNYDEFMKELGIGLELKNNFNEEIFNDNYLLVATLETATSGHRVYGYYDFVYNETDNSMNIKVIIKSPKGPYVTPSKDLKLNIIVLPKELFPENIEQIKDDIVIK